MEPFGGFGRGDIIWTLVVELEACVDVCCLIRSSCEKDSQQSDNRIARSSSIRSTRFT